MQNIIQRLIWKYGVIRKGSLITSKRIINQPLGILYRLAEKLSIVLLSGEEFLAPAWSIANLNDEAYSRIGRGTKKCTRRLCSRMDRAKKVIIN